MNKLENIIGNKRIINNVRKSIKENSTSHAYVFMSEDKEASKEIVYAIAKAMMCADFDKKEDSCQECKSCLTFDSGNNPDLKIISVDQINKVASSKDKTKIISIDHIKDLLVSDAIYAPVCSKYKVYVIEDADLMTENAQNALLKTLEEPNEYVKIFLIASKESSLLQTIYSRSICIKVMPLKTEEIKQWALTNLDSTVYQKQLSELDYYARYASGSLTRFKNTINDEDFDSYKNFVQEIALPITTGKFEDFEECKDKLNDDIIKENINKVLDILSIWYRDIMLAKNIMSDMIVNVDRKEIIREQARNIKEDKVTNAIKAIEKFKEDLRNRANYKIAVEVFLINISEVIK